MAERVRSTKAVTPAAGKRGRKLGGMNAATRFAHKKARARGMLPAELLHEWALKGVMHHGGNEHLLDIKDRIDCAKACARYFSPIMQPVPAEDARPPVYKIQLDFDQLGKRSVTELTQLRKLLGAVQRGDAIDPALLGEEEEVDDEDTNPDRYAELLTADSDTAGNA